MIEYMESKISITNKPTYTQKWYVGNVTYEGEKYFFWLSETDEYAQLPIDISWFYKKVPMEVRGMTQNIIDVFLKQQEKYDSFVNEFQTNIDNINKTLLIFKNQQKNE